MKIAFYAPLKPPDHPNPSGDRLLARSLVAALRLAGHEVEIASCLRAFEGRGNAERQREIEDAARAQADVLIRRYRSSLKPDLWFTYHVYHKAPDWIGPRVADALGIPYIVAEASVSPKQANGPWAAGHVQAVKCIKRADAMVALNRRDLPCAAAQLSRRARLLEIRPFIDLETWLGKPRRSQGPVRLAAVGMMRRGDKSESWSLLADWIEKADRSALFLDAVGDGAGREEVERNIRRVLGDRACFHGRVEGDGLRQLLDGCHLFVWPAINEAFGMALLEAQARGLAVLAGRQGGVSGVVRHGFSGLLVEPRDAQGAGRALAYLADRPAVIARMGEEARHSVKSHHGLDTAALQLDELTKDLCAKSS